MIIRSTHKRIALAVICTILFTAGLVQLLLLRFEAGDVYPPYSSLRSDPLGIQVLYESVDRVSTHSIQRNYHALDHIAWNPQTTLVVAGLPHRARYLKHRFWQRVLDGLHENGGRLVLTFTPDPGIKSRKSSEPTDDANATDESRDGNQTEPIEEFILEESLPDDPDEKEEKWRGIASFGTKVALPKHKPHIDTAVRNPDRSDHLPREIPWPTPLHFETREPEWHIDYLWQDKPVIIRRDWGKGSLIMVADSFLLSNEALSGQRQTGLLAWILAPDHTIIFDESHHGLVKRPGIASLARKYRLHGVFGCLLLVAVLFIWRQAAVFAPPLSEDRPGTASVTAGLNTHEGLVNLMRRHIDTRQLLHVCFDVWSKSQADQVSDATLQKIKHRIDRAGGRDPGPAYRNICELLKQGNDS